MLYFADTIKNYFFMKTLLFHVNSLLAGGIEKVLIELLHGLDPAKYNIKLSIAHNLGELELLRDQLPVYVTVSYILDTPILTNTKKKKVTKSISFPEKLFEDLVLPIFKKRMHNIKLRELMKDADIVIDFDMTLAGYTKLLKDKKKVAYCHFSFAHYWEGNKRKLDKLAARLSRYDKVVMLCDEMKNNITASYPLLSENVIRIYNAVDTQRLHTLAQESLGAYDYLIQEGYFLSVGRLAESQKDFTTLIKGYAACVKKYGVQEKLVIVGAGYSREPLEALAKELGIAEQVIFTGFQANPYKWMKNCTLFLFSSKFEGLPTVLIEALSLSCPIIATTTPTGVEEILMYGKAGTLTKVGDDTAMCEAIHILLHDDELKKRYHEQSQEILKKFEIQYMVREFERLIVA
jgi:glycosyltransferase involved in cell wall biosynthesis